MTVFLVETFIVKPDKLEEWTRNHKKFLAWMKKHPELFKEIKSLKTFSQLFGGNWGGYVEMWEADSVSDIEKVMGRLMQNKEYRTRLYPEAMTLVVPGTYSENVWKSII